MQRNKLYEIENERFADDRSGDVLSRRSSFGEAESIVEGGEAEGSRGRETGAKVCQSSSIRVV